MKVSEVRLSMLKTENAVRAIGSFSLDGAFAVRGVRVMEDKNGRNFVAFPSREKADGSYDDIAFPLSKELYAEITGAILEEYKKQQEQTQEQNQEQWQEQTQQQNQEQQQEQMQGASEEKATAKRGKSR